MKSFKSMKKLLLAGTVVALSLNTPVLAGSCACSQSGSHSCESCELNETGCGANLIPAIKKNKECKGDPGDCKSVQGTTTCQDIIGCTAVWNGTECELVVTYEECQNPEECGEESSVDYCSD